MSEGWIRVALGKKVDRHGRPLTIKLAARSRPGSSGRLLVPMLRLRTDRHAAALPYAAPMHARKR